jgi:diaminopimelate decarboxylase
LATAWKRGVDPARIYFHGNNKSEQELAAALAAGISLVVDNWLELETLHRLTLQNGQAENRPAQNGQTKSEKDQAPASCCG